jgi:hypothetical protein
VAELSKQGVQPQTTSTSKYVEDLSKYLIDNQIQLPQKKDQNDLFVYVSDFNQYWSGFYTSKALSKMIMRTGSRYLQAFRKIFA